MERGWLANSGLSRSEGFEVGLPGCSDENSPTEKPVLSVLCQGFRSTTPQGLGVECVRASSIAMMLQLSCKSRKNPDG
jgi:hypothetical protein